MLPPGNAASSRYMSAAAESAVETKHLVSAGSWFGVFGVVKGTDWGFSAALI